MSAARKLYQHESSPYCRKIRWVLARKGLEYAAVEADESVRAELARLAPDAEVPLLVAGESAVAGAKPIAFYLERVHPEPSIFPADPQKRNQAVTLAEFADDAIGRLTERLAAPAPVEDTAALLAELRQCLGQVREVIARRALDSGACHLGDIGVAAHLVTCAGIPGLDFAADYADLTAYVERVRALCGGPA